MQKARRQPHRNRSSGSCLRPLVGTWFQVLFHSPPGVLFTFPSRYWFTIGRQRVFSLGRWSSQIPTGFHVSRGTWELYQKGAAYLSPTGLSPSLVGLSRHVRLDIRFLTPRLAMHGSQDRVPQPRRHNACRLEHAIGLGCSPFARRYSGNRVFFLFLEVLRCFSSPRSLHPAYVFSRR